jgi:hypothetical protein
MHLCGSSDCSPVSSTQLDSFKSVQPGAISSRCDSALEPQSGVAGVKSQSTCSSGNRTQRESNSPSPKRNHRSAGSVERDDVWATHNQETAPDCVQSKHLPHPGLPNSSHRYRAQTSGAHMPQSALLAAQPMHEQNGPWPLYSRQANEQNSGGSTHVRVFTGTSAASMRSSQRAQPSANLTQEHRFQMSSFEAQMNDRVLANVGRMHVMGHTLPWRIGGPKIAPKIDAWTPPPVQPAALRGVPYRVQGQYMGTMHHWNQPGMRLSLWTVVLLSLFRLIKKGQSISFFVSGLVHFLVLKAAFSSYWHGLIGSSPYRFFCMSELEALTENLRSFPVRVPKHNFRKYFDVMLC